MFIVTSGCLVGVLYISGGTGERGGDSGGVLTISSDDYIISRNNNNIVQCGSFNFPTSLADITFVDQHKIVILVKAILLFLIYRTT